MKPKPPKKTETLEVRLPHGVKQALMAKARRRGRTASAVIRELIDSYLADATALEARPMFRRLAKPAAVTSVAASALALYALVPTAAAAAPDLQAIFDDLDRDGNGLLAMEEFLNRGGEPAARLRPVDSAFVRTESRVGTDPKPRPMLVRQTSTVQLPEGTLSIDVRAAMRRPFDEQDTDADGAVTFAEFEKYHVAILREGFDALDSDGNGTIEPREYTVRPKGNAPVVSRTSFREADRDRDGRLNWSEFLG